MCLNEEIDISQYDLVTIKSVTKTGEIVPMNDIQVEDNQTFIIDNNILTHNSAIAKFVEIRDPETQAGMPLRGKVLNVTGKPAIEAMENDEVADIITAINLEFNEQMGDWIIPDNPKIYNVKFASKFELDDNGETVIKEVKVLNTDRFLINKRWVKIDELVEMNPLDWEYIKSIEFVEDANINDISAPDYFHFRRPWDFRGFRKTGVKYKVSIGREKFVCHDIDEVDIDGKWYKVSMLLKKPPKSKKTISIEKAEPNEKLTRFHKYLKPAFDTKLKFSKIYIATDADPDGSAICNLLINLFHEYFPELYWDEENKFVNRIIFPMIAAQKGKKTKYYSNRPEFEAAKEKGEVDETWKITYFKGLGSMENEDWDHVFKNLDDYTFGVYDDGSLDELLQIFFDNNADIRKEWLATK